MSEEAKAATDDEVNEIRKSEQFGHPTARMLIARIDAEVRARKAAEAEVALMKTDHRIAHLNTEAAKRIAALEAERERNAGLLRAPWPQEEIALKSRRQLESGLAVASNKLEALKAELADEVRRRHVAEFNLKELRNWREKAKAELAEAEARIGRPETVHVGESVLQTKDLDAMKRRLAAAERLAELVKRASTDSCTTTGEQGGPGCFYCDIEDGHAESCEAVEALRAFEEFGKPGLDHRDMVRHANKILGDEESSAEPTSGSA